MMWTMDAGPRQPHAVLDLPSRRWKGEKIERLLGMASRQGPIRMLEVGTGSGGIAHYFGTQPGGRYQVTGVDVVDQRLVRDGYDFQLVHDTALPFADASFDVVLTNHVIEHVGEREAQLAHLREVRRVMTPAGVGYLAVPNRWMLVEPHFRLPLLSWLPAPIADAYVRAAGRGTHYDCRPLTCRELEGVLAAAGFGFRQRHADALRLTYDLERPDSLFYRWLFKPAPDWAFDALRRIFPTLIYTLTPSRQA